MRESMTYQATLEEDRVEGSLETLRQTVLLSGARKF